MLTNNLTARTVTKNQVVSSSGQTDVQRATLIFGPSYVARALVTIQNSSGEVTTETVATPTAAYLRYAAITDAAKKHDYSKLVNTWAKAGDDDTGTKMRQIFNNSLLDLSLAPIPPVGYVDNDIRSQLLDYITDQSVFAPDYENVKSQVVNGRQVYTYTVTVKLAPYLRMMQEFARVYGLKDLDNISPNEYQAASLKLDISVDKLSHQMARVSSTALGLNETFTDYGLKQTIELPSKTVSVSELQSRLQAVK
jgi:hypothetical protein